MVKCLQGQFKPTRVVLHLIILWCNKKKEKSPVRMEKCPYPSLMDLGHSHNGVT